ncbi:hypothetical protein [Rhizobium leucaenae]|uniref:FkbM family methyltransferase n=1 Tax=Rhizobium leucaenae TaxID=29450 RepID=A0A7W6ZZX0_9HYPH|nr:hypothetical protein [Rhizobium leucaenae]MBB4571685.1 hypothetical protein [Rhizobium leucaenae]
MFGFKATRRKDRLQALADQLERVSFEIKAAGERMAHLDAAVLERLAHFDAAVSERLAHVDATLHEALNAQQSKFVSGFHEMREGQLVGLNPQLRRNVLPNFDAVNQKLIMAAWRREGASVIGYKDLLDSSFRVFSQNDEDGVLLRIFNHIGSTNKYVVEIGSNCDGSDLGIPENLSTNLIVNHGWHGAIFELDVSECDRMQYFFARNYATKHFHARNDAPHRYFSPIVVQSEVTPDNVNQLLHSASVELEPDLMVVDIDGGDYAVVRAMTSRPRVLVVEFEKYFRDRYSVVQFDRNHFGNAFAQSGATSLPAWHKLLEARDYTLCAIGTCGFNAFFVRNDVATGKLQSLALSSAFDNHPILSKLPNETWLTPDQTWEEV